MKYNTVMIPYIGMNGTEEIKEKHLEKRVYKNCDDDYYSIQFNIYEIALDNHVVYQMLTKWIYHITHEIVTDDLILWDENITAQLDIYLKKDEHYLVFAYVDKKYEPLRFKVSCNKNEMKIIVKFIDYLEDALKKNSNEVNRYNIKDLPSYSFK